jgi:hypothetical protein
MVTDAKGRVVAVGDEICLDDGWHKIKGMESGLKVFSKDGSSAVLSVAVLANGASWNVAVKETRAAVRTKPQTTNPEPLPPCST